MDARRGVVPLVAVIVGIGLMAWSFTSGVSAALDGTGFGAVIYHVVFVAAAILVVTSLVISVINLIRGDSRVLAVITIVVAFIPVIGVVVLALSANAT